MLPGPLEVLVGTRMPDRSKVIGQTKRNLPVLQVWRFAQGQQQTVTSTRNSTSPQDGFLESSSRRSKPGGSHCQNHGSRRPKITWRRTVHGERNATDGKTWSSIPVMEKDWQKWRDHVAALHATRRNGHE